MKRLQKFAALLLAGVLMLMLFTACSGGGSERDTESEALVLNAINGKRSTSGVNTMSNDAEMQKLAWNALCDIQVDAESGKGAIAWNKAHKVTRDDGKTTIVNVATNGGVHWNENALKVNATAFQSTAMDNLLNNCCLFQSNINNISFDLNSPWVKVGVAARRVNGQTYIAVAVEING